MSWIDAVEAPGIGVGHSPYESARFGLTIDRITVSATSAAGPGDLMAEVSASAADVIIVRYPAVHVGWFALLAGLGRTALLADTLSYWRLAAGSGRRSPRPASTDIIPVPDDPGGIAITEALIGEIFTGYRNHYAADPLFDEALVRAGYQEWACRSLAAGRSLMMCDKDAEPAASVPIGMSVAEHAGEHVEIVLAGVVPHAQGRGMYGHLLAAVEDLALEEGASSVVISTQGHNNNVQRAWARYGFEPAHSLITAHLVRPELLRGR